MLWLSHFGLLAQITQIIFQLKNSELALLLLVSFGKVQKRWKNVFVFYFRFTHWASGMGMPVNPASEDTTVTSITSHAKNQEHDDNSSQISSVHCIKTFCQMITLFHRTSISDKEYCLNDGCCKKGKKKARFRYVRFISRCGHKLIWSIVF